MNNFLYASVLSILNEPTMAYADSIYYIAVLTIAIACIVEALYGYRLFFAMRTLNGALLIGVLGYFVGMVVELFLTVPTVNIKAVVGIIFAALGAFFAHHLAIVFDFLIGGGIGYLFGNYITLPILRLFNPYFFDVGPTIWVNALSALILSAISMFFFKHIFISVTSFCCMLTAAYTLGVLIVPVYNTNYVAILVVLGIIGGFFSTIYQFYVNGKNCFDVFI